MHSPSERVKVSNDLGLDVAMLWKHCTGDFNLNPQKSPL